MYICCVGKMLNDSVEQHVNAIFLIKLGKSITEILCCKKCMVMTQTQVSEWIKRFKETREDIVDDLHLSYS